MFSISINYVFRAHGIESCKGTSDLFYEIRLELGFPFVSRATFRELNLNLELETLLESGNNTGILNKLENETGLDPTLAESSASPLASHISYENAPRKEIEYYPP